MTVPNRIKLLDHLKSLVLIRPINRAHMDDIVEIHGRIVVQKLGDFMKLVRA